MRCPYCNSYIQKTNSKCPCCQKFILRGLEIQDFDDCLGGGDTLNKGTSFESSAESFANSVESDSYSSDHSYKEEEFYFNAVQDFFFESDWNL